MGNRFRYKPQPSDTIIELKVRVLLNPDPDAYWSKPEDIIKEIEGHNYVQSVELVEGGAT